MNNKGCINNSLTEKQILMKEEHKKQGTKLIFKEYLTEEQIENFYKNTRTNYTVEEIAKTLWLKNPEKVEWFHMNSGKINSRVLREM